MLVLSRKAGEVITIGSSIRITVLSHERGIVRLGIEAPRSVAVHRKEVYDKIIEANINAAKTEPGALKRFVVALEMDPTIEQESKSLAFIANTSKSQENNENAMNKQNESQGDK
ncbi:MAG TPA: carbon storage regulator CsrA [Patescibacteria group bacterium]|nr:carbon storage regulator CsrA [Patescibacteria group bacterium]